MFVQSARIGAFVQRRSPSLTLPRKRGRGDRRQRDCDKVFSGIVEAVGTLNELVPQGSDVHIRVATGSLDLTDVKIGDSICVSGVCLTATAVGGGAFEADLSAETLARTTLGRRKTGDKLNL